MKLAATVRSAASRTIRARQLEGAFDVPGVPHQERSWSITAPIEDRDWAIGLIVGPSGSGKSTLLGQFGAPRRLEWAGASVIDDFDPALKLQDVTAACSAVGFNTIPAWLRPYATLSNGEQFRVTLARLIAEAQPGETVLIDEFTSVVDRQVAKIASHALAKYARKRGTRVIVASCHDDILDWLQPDWVIDPVMESFCWRSVQSRPQLEVEIGACGFAEWGRFAPFHYLTADLHRAARTFCLWVDGTPAAFAGVLTRPVSRSKRTGQNLMGLSRLVTLPDWQGLGLAFVLTDTVAGAYKAVGRRFNTYPAHPALIRSFDRSKNYSMIGKPGFSMSQRGGTDKGRRILATADPLGGQWNAGSRPCATFRYIGPALDDRDARQLLGPYLREKLPA